MDAIRTLVFIELTVAEAEGPLVHLQVEGLAFDPRAAAWGRRPVSATVR